MSFRAFGEFASRLVVAGLLSAFVLVGLALWYCSCQPCYDLGP